MNTQVVEGIEEPNEPINITKLIRSSNDMSLSEFAEFAGVNAGTVLRTDQGTYRKIPGAVIEGLQRLEPGYTENLLQFRYHRFVRSKRRWSQDVQEFKVNRGAWWRPAEQGHPLKYFRRVSGYPTVMGFCVAFCLHPSTIRRFEHGTTLNVPNQFVEFLRDIGYHMLEGYFQEVHDNWREHGRKI